MADLVWSRFGDVPNFVEPFFGSGAVLLARPTVPRTETVNDADAFLSNFWRAVQADPEAVAKWADWPVNENDLHARHLWLVNEGRTHVERLTTDPEYYDAKIAGWWVWGICQWIGSGWCSSSSGKPLPLPSEGASGALGGGDGGDAGRGVHRQRPHLGNAGRGVHRQLPHLGNAGRGVHRQLPHLGDAGMGVHRQRPHLGDAGRVTKRDALIEYFGQLQERLRGVRVCCGDWERVCGPSPTFKHGMTAVFLDPPYTFGERREGLYSVETDVAADVRRWCLENGDNPLLRIALCGYAGEHEMPETWEAVAWKAHGGYGSQGEGRGRENAEREMVWFSPACLKEDRPKQGVLGL